MVYWASNSPRSSCKVISGCRLYFTSHPLHVAPSLLNSNIHYSNNFSYHFHHHSPMAKTLKEPKKRLNYNDSYRDIFTTLTVIVGVAATIIGIILAVEMGDKSTHCIEYKDLTTEQSQEFWTYFNANQLSIIVDARVHSSFPSIDFDDCKNKCWIAFLRTKENDMQIYVPQAPKNFKGFELTLSILMSLFIILLNTALWWTDGRCKYRYNKQYKIYKIRDTVGDHYNEFVSLYSRNMVIVE